MIKSVTRDRFSRRAIKGYEPNIRKKVEYVCDQLRKVSESGEPINIINAFAAFAGDVIMEYCYGFGYDHLKNPGFVPNLYAALAESSHIGHLALQFKFLHPVSLSNTNGGKATKDVQVLQLIPDKVNEKINPVLTELLRLMRVRLPTNFVPH